MTRKSLKNSYVLSLYLLTDMLAAVCSFMFAFVIANAFNRLFYARLINTSASPENLQHIIQFSVIVVGVLIWFGTRQHYYRRMPFWQASKDITTGACFGMVVEGFLQFASKQDFSRLWLVLSWVFFALGVIILRMALRFSLKQRHLWSLPTLLVGDGALAQNVLQALRSEPDIGYNIVTQTSDITAAFQKAGQSWKSLCDKHQVSYIIIALDAPELREAEDALAKLIGERLPFSIVPPLSAHMPVAAMEPHFFFNKEAMLLVPLRGLQQPLPRFIKRFLDIVISSMALLLLSPFLLSLAILIKSDGGPAFFHQQRLGKNGKLFSCLKFRTMVVNSEEALKAYLSKNPEAAEAWQKDWKLRDDPRITRLGRFLRKWSLDEIPQLINVLRGDMSLVGPRPIVSEETTKYSGDLQYYFSVRPGLTGLWQVSGRNDVTYPMRVHMDSWYVRNWSVWHDFVILIKTLRVVISRSGAY